MRRISTGDAREVRRLEMLVAFSKCLLKRAITPQTAQTYLSSTVSFLVTVADTQNVSWRDFDQEASMWSHAQASDWDCLQAGREKSLTARVLTLNFDEVRQALLQWMPGRNVTVIASYLSNTGQFFHWLERRKLIQRNSFHEVHQKIELKYGSVVSSLQSAATH